MSKKAAPVITNQRQLSDLIIKQISEIAHRAGKYAHQTFEDWVGMCSCALSNGTREEEYLRIVGRYKKPEVEQLATLFGAFVEGYENLEFEDVLGPIHMELGSKSAKSASGEFYTPWSLCVMMARMILGDLKDIPTDRPLTIAEPASGAGAMILAAAQHFHYSGHSVLNMLVTATDVSYLATRMCHVQLSLWGIPAKIVHGNTLSGECWDELFTPTYSMARGSGVSQLSEKLLGIIRSINDLKESQPSWTPDFTFDTNGQGVLL